VTSDETTEQARVDAREARLARGRVLVVGVGGLGCAAALHLAEAGVGIIGLADGDRVELSNLQRQILHSADTVGRPKVESGADSLRRIRPELELRLHPQFLDEGNAAALFEAYDFVIDATDGAAAKFLLNDTAVATGTPLSHAGVVGWSGQTMTILPGVGACYRCLFPAVPDEDDLPTCQTAGVLGSVVGIVGVVQAVQAVKFLAGDDGLLVDRLLTYDALANRWRAVPLYRNPRCPVCGERGFTAGREGAPAH